MAMTGSVSLSKVPRALNFSPDGKLLYFTQAGVDAVQVLDPTTNQILTQIAVGASPHHPLFTPDGQTALVVSQGPGTLSLINPQNNAVSKVVQVGKMPHWIAVNPQGTTAWVTNEVSNDVSVVDLATGTVTATIPIGNAPRKIVVQPKIPAAGQTSPSNQAAASITISGMAFSQQTVTVKAGQTISWTNQDSITHTVTADQGKWDSGAIDPGKSYSLTLSLPGRYDYHCSIHPFMKGTVVVTP
jgi:YVTN family beta-propeller protein